MTTPFVAVPQEAFSNFKKGTSFESLTYDDYLKLVAATFNYHGKSTTNVVLTAKTLAKNADVAVVGVVGTADSALTTLLTAIDSAEKVLPLNDYTAAIKKAAERLKSLPSLGNRYAVEVSTYKESHQTTYWVSLTDLLANTGTFAPDAQFSVFQFAEKEKADFTAAELAEFLNIPLLQ